MSEPVDWRARLEAQIIIYRTKRARLDAFRADRARRRRLGLRARYQQKLDHLRRTSSPGDV